MATTTHTRPRFGLRDAGLQIVNLILGIWLFISAFAWTHTAAERADTWILGVIIAVIAVVAMFVPVVHWVNTAAAVWLFVTTLAIRHVSPGTVWNNCIVAVLVFLFSLPSAVPVGNGRTGMPTTPRAA